MGSLANLTSGVISTLSTVNSAFNTLNRAYDVVNKTSGGEYRELQIRQQQNLQQLQARQQLEQQQAAQNDTLKHESLRLETAQAEAARQRALKRAVARQTAAFGAQGIETGSGSGEALLLGVFDESEIERTDREARDNLRERAIGNSSSQSIARNLLEQTQLAERQRLERQYYRV